MRSPLSLFFAVAALGVLLVGLGGGRAAAAESASFSLRGSNGFVLDVSGEAGEVTVIASERRPPVPTFTVAGLPRRAGSGNGASTTYSAPATAGGPGVIDASLGTLGRIAVRFHPTGERTVTTLMGVCGRPIRAVRRLGTFSGTISFEGEDGYTAVVASKARGSVGTPLPPGCGPGAPASASALASSAGRAAGAVLTAAAPDRSSSFRAATGPGGVDFRAQVRERNADGVVVLRRAAAGAPLSAFDFNRALTWATVTPPAPFSGSARFATGGGPAWQGSLRVTFPGLSVPLAGPTFRARLGRP